jgi:hypothetical protein
MTLPTSGPNSAKPTTGEVVAGVYNATPPVLVDGQACPIQIDINGQIKTSGGGGATSNVNIADVAGSPPALANPLPVELSDGVNALGTDANPIRNSPSSTAAIQPVSGPLTDAQLRATPVPISGTVTATGPLTDTQLRATPVPVSGTVTATGPLTDTQLRATPVPVSGTITAITNQIDTNLKQVGGANTATAASGVQKVGIVGGAAGITLDAVLGATKPANVLQIGGNDGTNAFALPLVSGGGAVVDNISQWGGTAVSAPPATTVPATGSEVAPVVKNITHKTTSILSTTPLAGGGSFISSYFDTNATGDTFVETTILVTGGTNGLLAIQESDDSSDATQVSNVVIVTYSLSALNTILGQIRKRYWRVTVSNIGGTLQTTLKLTATAASVGSTAILGQGINNTNANQVPVSIVSSNSPSDGGAQPLGVLAGNATTQVLAVATYVAQTSGNTSCVLLRTPAIFKTATVVATAAGNTAVWTPAAGKKFRLMRFQITGVNLAATAATVITISFQDNVTGITIGTYDVLLPAIATATDVLAGGIQYISDWIDLGNGIISAVANNVLNANVSATVAGATGSFRYNVCGTEE